jgi:hypothetical protein
MSPQQRHRIDEVARSLVQRLRADNDAAATRGARTIDNDEYATLEAELRDLLADRAGDC